MACLSSRTSKRTMATVHELMFEFDFKSTPCSLLGPKLLSPCVKYEQKPRQSQHQFHNFRQHPQRRRHHHHRLHHHQLHYFLFVDLLTNKVFTAKSLVSSSFFFFVDFFYFTLKTYFLLFHFPFLIRSCQRICRFANKISLYIYWYIFSKLKKAETP